MVGVRLLRGVGWVGECLGEGFEGFGMGFEGLEDGVAEVANIGRNEGDGVGVAWAGGDVEGELDLTLHAEDGAEGGGGVEAIEGLVEDVGGLGVDLAEAGE